MNDTRKVTETTRMAMTNGVFQPCETPSDKPTRRRSRPEVNRKAPIQSTPEARGESTEFGDSFGITNTAAALTVKDAPAMTKKTTFQLAYSDMIPPWKLGLATQFDQRKKLEPINFLKFVLLERRQSRKQMNSSSPDLAELCSR